MKIAGSKFLGDHDFRNFCKMDAANVHNFRRTISIFEILPVNERSLASLCCMLSSLKELVIFKILYVARLQDLFDLCGEVGHPFMHFYVENQNKHFDKLAWLLTACPVNHFSPKLWLISRGERKWCFERVAMDGSDSSCFRHCDYVVTTPHSLKAKLSQLGRKAGLGDED